MEGGRQYIWRGFDFAPFVYPRSEIRITHVLGMCLDRYMTCDDRKRGRWQSNYMIFKWTAGETGFYWAQGFDRSKCGNPFSYIKEITDPLCWRLDMKDRDGAVRTIMLSHRDAKALSRYLNGVEVL